MKIINLKSRRDFLKLISLLSAGTAFSFRSGYFTEETGATTATDHFSLNKFYPVVDSLVIPQINHSAGESFEANYSLLSLGYDLLRKEGNVSFSLKNETKNIICECRVERNTESEDLKSIFHQKSRHLYNRYFSPEKWTRHSKMAKDFDSPAYPFTELTGEVRVNGNALLVSEMGKSVRKSLPGLPLLKWAHWALIPFLKENDDFTFDWIDEMEQIFNGHRIRFRETIVLLTGHGEVYLHSFQHTGTGILPTVYWLTGNNVLLFIISGTEIYVLDEFNGKQLNYDVPKGRLKRNQP